jgi:hypothetical protein
VPKLGLRGVPILMEQLILADMNGGEAFTVPGDDRIAVRGRGVQLLRRHATEIERQHRIWPGGPIDLGDVARKLVAVVDRGFDTGHVKPRDHESVVRRKLETAR